ncbi:MAG TPA: lysylphosphatidylglycerol synthase transmembrane domain-containing protein [Ktedonobacteraceae bacterium]|nr:lysylphosphatidylglycerol synthase transmembrane domain-containing protein [Ktedonobacteraceae bacterium]
MLTRKIRTGIVFSLVLAALVMAAIALYADLPEMLKALADFRWQFLPLILGLTLFNYCWRFMKWQYYLGRLEIHVPWFKSLLIFLSGLSMAITPGKIGELLKSYLLKTSTDIPISRSSPIIIAERLTDGIAMIGLAMTGLILYRSGWAVLLTLFFLGMAAILLIQNRRFSLALLDLGERMPIISRVAHLLRTFYESSYSLLQWRPLLLAILIGLISWTGECAALFFVYVGLGIPISVDLFIKSMFILAISSLVGSASGLPGGLGTADGSMLGLTHLLITSSKAIAGAATLLIRLCTLWFGLGLGVIALVLFRTTQHIDFSTVRREMSENQRTGVNDALSSDAGQTTSQTTSVLSSIGDKFR